MSGDWWANQIGTAAAVTTPSGSVPQYDLAYEIGTAPWQSQATFNMFVEDVAPVTHQSDLQRVEAAKEQAEQGWFQRAMGEVGADLSGIVGSASKFFQDPTGYFEGDFNDERRQEYVEEGTRQLSRFSESAVGQAIDAPFQALATPFVASTQEDIQNQSPWWFTDASNWSKAWAAAEERSVGEAFTDWIISGTNPNISTNKDLDRIRRTNSLYGITAFAADLAVGFKLDPSVVVAKGVGEVNAIRSGALPRGQTSGVAGAEALRTARGQGKYKGVNPLGHYGSMRGQQIFNNLDEVFAAAESMPYADFANMAMFKRKATNGQAAALAFYTAAKNPELRDLTKRAVLADLDALQSIKAMKEGTRPLIPGADTKTFIDAFEAQKTKFKEMDREVSDLEKRIAAGSKDDVLFDYYSKELHSTLDQRKADLEEISRELEQYDDYNTWLDSVPAFDNPVMLEQVKAKPATLDFLSQRTYQKNLYGKVHTVTNLAKSGWLREANPIDLHRVDTGVQSIRRQFEQFDRFFGYRNREAFDSTLQRFTQAISGGRHQDAYKIAKEVEDVHLVNAISQWSKTLDKREGTPGIDPETVRTFFDQVKFKRNEMTNALLSGDGAVYTTLDGDRARLLSTRNGISSIEVTEGGKRTTLQVPEDAIKAHLPQDPTQTPNYYMPLNTREAFLSIKHDPELWEQLDSLHRAEGRKAASAMFNSIDKAGTNWNRFWKPSMLFRLAWPQRVLMDEGLRGMALLGVSAFAKNYGAAFRTASVNALNPLEHPGTFPGAITGIGAVVGTAALAPTLAPFLVGPALLGGAALGAKATRRIINSRTKIGPGPVSDELSGRTHNVAAHEAEAEASPVVPAYYAPQKNAKRSVELHKHLATAKVARNLRAERAAAREKLGDANFSLVEDEMFPAQPVTSPFFAGVEKAVTAEGWGDGSASVFDPLNGRAMKAGFAVPIKTVELRSGTRLGNTTADEIEAFVEANSELLASGGYRLMVRQDGDALTLSVVRHFKGKNVREAADFSRHVENDFLVDLNDGGLEYYREWLDEDALKLDQQIAEVEKALDNEPTDMTPEGLATHLDETMDKMAERPRLLRRRQFGAGKTKFRSRDGKRVEVQNALEGAGQVYIPLMSGAPAYARLTDAYKRTLSMMRGKAVGHKRIMPPAMDHTALSTKKGREAATEYYTAWADLLNDQIRNSPIWFKMLEGQSDEQVLRWLENSAEGAKIRRELPHKSYNPERWVEEHRQALDMYLPRTDLQAVLKERRLQPSDLRVIDRAVLPEVYGPDLEMIDGGTELGRMWGDFVQKTYTALGTTPTDLLSRQPFFKGMYDLKMKNLVRAADEDQLTPEVLRGYEKLAREFALRQVKRNMYDLGDDTNFTQAIRFLAPFWGAQQEAITKWFNIAFERPETVARFYVGVDAAYENFKVVDEDGKTVKKPRSITDGIFGYEPNDRLMFQIPKTLAKMPPFDKILAGHLGEVGTSFGSLNTALQGDMFFMPSLGPLATVPADQFARAYWDTHGTQFDDEFWYRWLFPVGRPKSEKAFGRILEQTLPGWGKRMQSMNAGLDDHTLANTFFLIKREMEADARKNGRPMPTDKEIRDATDWHFALRTIASFGMPFAAQFRPKNQFYIDELHKMYEKHGSDALEKFIQKHGVEAANYAASSSERLIPATAQGQREWSTVKDLVNKYPEWSSAMVSPDAWADDYSPDSYNAQFNITLGPGTTETLARFKGPQERSVEINTQTGWIQFRQMMSGVNAQMYAEGYTSLQQSGAEELKAQKDYWVAQKALENPDWWQDYLNQEDTIYGKVQELQQWVGDSRFDNRPDIQGARQYLMIRQAAAQSLDQYAMATGGSRNLQAQENTALRQWFYGQVGQLILENPSFGEFYSRHLSVDRLERGSGP